MSSGAPGPAGSRRAALGEAAVVVGLGLAAVWLIPRQTASGPVLGLPPALLPLVCAWAIVALALFGLALRLWRPEAAGPERSAPVLPALLVGMVAVAGVLALQLLGTTAAGLLIVALGLAVIGERRPRIVVATLAGAALVLALVFQVWR